METTENRDIKPEEGAGKIPLQRLVMPSVKVINDALWWVSGGLYNANLTEKEHKRIKECRAALMDYIESRTFCNPDCSRLSPTEEEQESMKPGLKGVHMCGKFGKQVKHGDAHPMLYRLPECDEA